MSDCDIETEICSSEGKRMKPIIKDSLNEAERHDHTTVDLGIVFDPDQDAEEKRVLRRNYRALNKKIEQYLGTPEDLPVDDIVKEVKTANALYSLGEVNAKIKSPSEAILDSRFFMMAVNIEAQKVRAMKSGSGIFDVSDFVARLVRYMGGQSSFGDGASEDSIWDDDQSFGPILDWDLIGRRCMAKSRRVPVSGFMLGPLSLELKQRAAHKRSKLQRNQADEERPQELRDEDILRSENETTRNVAIMEAILHHFNIYENNPRNLFEVVINPHTFAQSVENLFFLSFLVRDGKVQVETRNGVPVVFLRDNSESVEYAEATKRKQMLLELDMETWKRAIQMFDIKESFIPERPRQKKD